jgi:acetoacetate decarboxylase
MTAFRLKVPPIAGPSLAHVYRMNDVDWLGAYGESNISVGCRLPGADIAGSYSPYLFLSSDVGVAHGREVHGQPKNSASRSSKSAATSRSASSGETGSTC